MKKLFLIILLSIFCQINYAQVNSIYHISFDNAVHHEASIHVSFLNIKTKDVEFRMSRTSPGRYALHEFVKNVYNVKVTDSQGKLLKTTRPDPYSWKVNGHDGSIKISYTLFANRGDGTYSQIDETHAHLNIPATFMYVPSLSKNEFEITFDIRNDLNWKIATQLKLLKDNTYYAKNLQYFMDSPTEISNFSKRSFEVESNGKIQMINFALHHNGTDAEFNEYFKRVKKVVLQEIKVFDELPNFDYGEYTFLGCYIPNASGDGMEHLNSTVLTSTRSLAKGGLKRNISTVSHEFFHAWNVERLRPKSLEPFNFEEANMSGELWFAEGFTSYYTTLILCRAGLYSQKEYIQSLQGSFNYVWNSSARQFFNPIEMSFQAPFVDAAKSVDEVNRENTFISYYSYGSMLGLALDLSLREINLNLDDYMKLVWNKYGKTHIYYTVDNLHQSLNNYAGKEFGNNFFENFIYKSKMPNYSELFQTVGVLLDTNNEKAISGIKITNQKISNYPKIDSPAYNAGLTKGDKIIKIGTTQLNKKTKLKDIVKNYKPNDTVTIIYERYGVLKDVVLSFQKDPTYQISLFENNDIKLKKKIEQHRNNWLQAK